MCDATGGATEGPFEDHGRSHNKFGSRLFVPGIFWWLRQIFLTVLGCFFLLFGIYLLISAYHLENPHWFIMTFFASNLIILISAALMIGFVLRMIAALKKNDKA